MEGYDGAIATVTVNGEVMGTGNVVDYTQTFNNGENTMVITVTRAGYKSRTFNFMVEFA